TGAGRNGLLAGDGGEFVSGFAVVGVGGFVLPARPEMWSIYVAGCLAGDMDDL
ncbi:Hypothetical predicted protein, partial [Olea europaea subsp. europaea]